MYWHLLKRFVPQSSDNNDSLMHVVHVKQVTSTALGMVDMHYSTYRLGTGALLQSLLVQPPRASKHNSIEHSPILILEPDGNK